LREVVKVQGNCAFVSASLTAHEGHAASAKDVGRIAALFKNVAQRAKPCFSLCRRGPRFDGGRSPTVSLP